MFRGRSKCSLLNPYFILVFIAPFFCYDFKINPKNIRGSVLGNEEDETLCEAGSHAQVGIRVRDCQNVLKGRTQGGVHFILNTSRKNQGGQNFCTCEILSSIYKTVNKIKEGTFKYLKLLECICGLPVSEYKMCIFCASYGNYNPCKTGNSISLQIIPQVGMISYLSLPPFMMLTTAHNILSPHVTCSIARLSTNSPFPASPATPSCINIFLLCHPSNLLIFSVLL